MMDSSPASAAAALGVPSSPEAGKAAHLNRECACLTLDHGALEAALAGDADFYPALRQSRPHLFSDTMVFVGEAHLEAMAALAAAVEEVSHLPAYQEAVLAWAPPMARLVPAQAGVFLGYDFHLTDAGPQLIEINTNAGGALLNAKLARAQRSCCHTVAPFVPQAGDVEAEILAMFRQEWALARGAAPLRRIAIVDSGPAEQYLAPEFELFRRLFSAAGLAAVIADPAELSYRDGILWHDQQPVDLVYNRLTDFALEAAAHLPLAQAYRDGAVVITPHPRAHALFADKRNLVLLSDPDRLAELGVPDACRRIFAATIPLTRQVTAAAAEQWWQARKRWFFKPASGFGSRAAYRGDKLTKRVFEEIIAAGDGAYVAQALVPPSERRIAHGPEPAHLKLDIRAYVYRGRVQLTAARLYQGQTTNFRTPGGGFAAVFPVPRGEGR